MFVEAIWRLSRIKSRPPITRTALALIGGAVDISDQKARKELGYKERFV
jgi:hypothetical protein